MPIFKPASVLLKLSGEILSGNKQSAYDYAVIDRITDCIIKVRNQGFRIGVVIGGGNIFRGSSELGKMINRNTADNIGMLATIQNALLISEVLNRKNYPSSVFSAVQCDKIAEYFTWGTANSDYQKGKICFFSGGTGNPYFTTDTAAVLRAVEIGAGLVLKGTKVDGVFTADPAKDPKAELIKDVTFDRALAEKLNVMDMTAFSLARDYQMPVKVFNINEEDSILRAIIDNDFGTLVHP
ncbi:MAG: UMP kinase [Candidatus Cloacimonetes bacterium]|nr:UMP kinase [Candidatus Cloacimonadota bacterium]